MTTQLAIDLSPTAPIRTVVQAASLPETCPVRDRCLLAILTNAPGYRCGFEQAGTVNACPKRREK